MGFSKQDYWSGLPLPSQQVELVLKNSPANEEDISESEVAKSCPTLSDPMDCSLPGSSNHGIFQAEVLEWGAIAGRVTSGF